ncbi:MAG: hypothetical protein M1825_002929 [Sarcosagium campestre]|nr:MAG: hypothetical protein M1825_002929 [Sarcosagium campestre]
MTPCRLLVLFVWLTAVTSAFPHLGHLAEAHKKLHRRADFQKRATPFDPVAQKIDVSGPHAWQAPTSGQSRGPCPAQNALANHGYLDRSGYTTLTQCINANVQILSRYNDALSIPGLSEEHPRSDAGGILSSFLGQFDSSNLAGLTWAIGNSSAVDSTIANACPPILGGILNPLVCNVLNPLLDATIGAGFGLAQTHNNFEGDHSMFNFDWGNRNGADASSIHIPYFQQMWDDALPDGTFDDFTIFKRHARRRFDDSIHTNPCFFNAPFAGVVAATGAHAFAARVFANHSAVKPDGTLSKATLASFFGVQVNPDGSLACKENKCLGQERIPDNWYKRATPYGIAQFTTTDFAEMIAYDPRIISIGGNTGGPDTFTGVDIGDLSGGVYNSANLLQGNNFACLYYRLLQATVNWELENPVGGVLLGLGSTLGAVIDAVFNTALRSGTVSSCPTANIKDVHSYTQYCGVTRQSGLIF